MSEAVLQYGAVEWGKSQNSNFKQEKDWARFDFFKASPGENTVRIVTAPYSYQAVTLPKKNGKGFPARVKVGDNKETDPVLMQGHKPKQRFFVGIINRKVSKIQLLEMSGMHQDQIYALSKKWGSPTGWDLDINCDPDGGASNYYSYVPCPPAPLSEEDVAMLEEYKEDLEKVLQALSAIPTPEAVQKKIDVLDLDVSPRQYDDKKPKEEKKAASTKEVLEVTSDDDYSFDDDD